MNYDYLVVGQGLAGTILAHTLRQQSLHVLVIDEDRPDSASKVAAGLINPIAGKRMARSWRIDELLPAARAFYRSLEQHLGSRLLHEQPLIKLFATVAEQNDWVAKTADPGYAAYISEDKLAHPQAVQRANGSVQISGGGYVDLPLMLRLFRERLAAESAVLNEVFDHRALFLAPDGVHYQEHTARGVVFCEGYRALQNPWFSWLPVFPTKGEILEVELKDFEAPCIYNRGVYVVPSEAGTFKIGATYDWRQPDEQSPLRKEPLNCWKRQARCLWPRSLCGAPGGHQAGGARPQTARRVSPAAPATGNFQWHGL